jgi:type II secretory pathway predicted ATPase ExeA
MVEAHFGLRQRPFPSTPDPGTYYPATTHERALARLLRGLADGEGLLLLTGAPGSGKSLLGHCLLERLGPDAHPLFLTNGHLRDRVGLFQAILFDLGLAYEGKGEQELRLAVTNHLLQAFAAGRPTVLLVDEAHLLAPDLLEELRLLGNLEGRSGKALQVVLLGQPAFSDVLRRPELASFRQRLAVRAELRPLGVQEAADYLLHHVRSAGGKPARIFSDEALELLARATGGVPRLLNQAAHQAMTLAAEAGAGEVDAEAALESLNQLGLDEEAEAAEKDPGEGTGVAAEPVLLVPLQQGEAGANAEEDDPSCRLFVAP